MLWFILFTWPIWLGVIIGIARAIKTQHHIADGTYVAPEPPSQLVRTYTGHAVFEREAAKMIAKGWKIQSQSARKGVGAAVISVIYERAA